MSTFQLIPNLSTSQPASAPGVEQRRERVKVTTARGGEEGFDNFLRDRRRKLRGAAAMAATFAGRARAARLGQLDIAFLEV